MHSHILECQQLLQRVSYISHLRYDVSVRLSIYDGSALAHYS